MRPITAAISAPTAVIYLVADFSCNNFQQTRNALHHIAVHNVTCSVLHTSCMSLEIRLYEVHSMHLSNPIQSNPMSNTEAGRGPHFRLILKKIKIHETQTNSK